MRRKKIFQILKMFICGVVSLTATGSLVAVNAYTNPFELDEQWVWLAGRGDALYGAGDPYVFKYNGLYYLFPSTENDSLGFKVWTSPDLVNWTYAGNVGEEGDRTTKGAYAPEVTYWNGTFYLYSATPNGAVHKVYTATNPLGPYTYKKALTGSIDGSVYIDDDENATKYFFDASAPNIRMYQLNDDMLRTKNGPVNLSNVSVNGMWTEGASVFKRQGKYYMTYTGNHVVLDSYMIEYAVGDSVEQLKEPKNNRLLISTDSQNVGLGHNSVVVGPDLDSYYIVYHSLVSPRGPQRRMNIDRLVFNGDIMSVLGPTSWEMSNPALPEFYDHVTADSLTNNWTETAGGLKNTVVTDSFISQEAAEGQDKELILSAKQTADDYTAEFNLKLSDTNTLAGGVVSYTNDENYVFAYIDAGKNQICLEFVYDGTSEIQSANLPVEYIYNSDVLRKLTVKKQGNQFDVYVDDRLCISAESASGAYGIGNIGLCTKAGTALFGYSAFSRTVNGNMDNATEKPTDTPIQAVHANSTSRKFETSDEADENASASRSVLKNISEGDWLKYTINAQNYFGESPSDNENQTEDESQTGTENTAESGVHNYVLTLRVKTDEAYIRVKVDGNTAINSKKIASGNNDYVTISLPPIQMKSGINELTIEVLKGELDISDLYVTPDMIVNGAVITEDSGLELNAHEGSWQTDGVNKLKQDSQYGFGKLVAGNEYWNDYTIESTITAGAAPDAGILFRLRYSATGAFNVSISHRDYHQGYYAYINSNGVNLGKQNFGWTNLVTAPVMIEEGKDYVLKVEAAGCDYKIYLDGKLMIEYTDNDYPFFTGKIGLRTTENRSSFKNTSVTFPDKKSYITDDKFENSQLRNIAIIAMGIVAASAAIGTAAVFIFRKFKKLI